MVLKWIIQRRFDHPFKDGHFGSEWPATMDRNRWPSCFGMGGHFGSESVARMRRNMQEMDRRIVYGGEDFVKDTMTTHNISEKIKRMGRPRGWRKNKENRPL